MLKDMRPLKVALALEMSSLCQTQTAKDKNSRRCIKREDSRGRLVPLTSTEGGAVMQSKQHTGFPHDHRYGNTYRGNVLAFIGIYLLLYEKSPLLLFSHYEGAKSGGIESNELRRDQGIRARREMTRPHKTSQPVDFFLATFLIRLRLFSFRKGRPISGTQQQSSFQS